MDYKPLVSIVIPVYNGEKFLGEAIESCLLQTLASIEVIVVIDASPDNSLNIVQEFAASDSRVKIIVHQENKGVSCAFNSGFREAKGEYFARLAQDDILFPHALERMSTFLKLNTEIGLTYGNQDFIDENGNYLSTLKTNEGKAALHPRNRIGLLVMWLRDVWEVTGEFDSKCDFAEDYDYWLRVERHFKLAKCADESLVKFRYHGSQNSITGEQKQKKAVERAFMKHRFYQWRLNPINITMLVRAFKHAFSTRFVSFKP